MGCTFQMSDIDFKFMRHLHYTILGLTMMIN